MEEEIEKVTEEVTENTEAQTVEEMEEGIELTDTANTEESKETVEEKQEEQPKGRFMTDEDIDNLVMKKVNRRMAKFEAQKEKELYVYKDTENVLKSTLGASDINEANKKLREYYESEGIKLPDVYQPGLTKKEIEVLAKAEAQEIIYDGYDAMLEEANKLAQKKYVNLSDKEKVIFNTLAEELNYAKDRKELQKLGAKEELLNDEEFKKFRNQFNLNTPIKDVYDLYQKVHTKKPKAENPGSMRSSSQEGEKTFISEAEYDKMTDEEIEKNMDLIRKSMYKW